MEIPDVTGFTLGVAVDILKAAGIAEIKVELTAPPREINKEYNCGSRVVRQKTSAGGTAQELVVCNL